MEISFAQIDAKDYDVISIDGSYYGKARSKKNVETMYSAMAEYLERLDALQKEIAEKFEGLLEDDSHIKESESFCQVECLCDEGFCRSGEHSHLYYT